MFDDYDSDANMRQLRSKFTHPHTYLAARKGHEWLDTNGLMPYTVFTLLDAFDRDYSTDARTASMLLVAIADAVRWNSGILLKSNMEDIINNAKSSDTNTSQLLTKLYSLFSDDESLQIIGSSFRLFK